MEQTINSPQLIDDLWQEYKDGILTYKEYDRLVTIINFLEEEKSNDRI